MSRFTLGSTFLHHLPQVIEEFVTLALPFTFKALLWTLWSVFFFFCTSRFFLLTFSIQLSQADKEPILSSFLYASILSHHCLESALGFVLANRLQNPTLLATQLIDIFDNVMMNDNGIQRSVRLDLQVTLFSSKKVSSFTYFNWLFIWLFLELLCIYWISRIISSIQALKDRDPACASYSWALLYLKAWFIFFLFNAHRLSASVFLNLYG